ncbi:hypothetical protein F0562_005463 [Nyssa sinensis]|uniref:Uncharacterized protein n=1 Tax=Nyssa sinensis TaxID=561372 RepID=A0A5J5AKQ4_9ASTE|nr:hypothetical protein F0562_005463 [Nyssa sinensis]
MSLGGDGILGSVGAGGVEAVIQRCPNQGLVVDGGGERKGIVGNVVGMVGIVGIVVGMVGSEAAGNGGSVTFGRVGMIGNVGFGRDGIWVLGRGGNVGFGRVGAVGNVGSGVLGNGGNVALGSSWHGRQWRQRSFR